MQSQHYLISICFQQIEMGELWEAVLWSWEVIVEQTSCRVTIPEAGLSGPAWQGNLLFSCFPSLRIFLLLLCCSHTFNPSQSPLDRIIQGKYKYVCVLFFK